MGKIQTALESETANQSSTLKLSLQDLMTTLVETDTVSNFPTLQWPNLPDNPGQGMKIKLRTCHDKKQEYFSIEGDCRKNQSRISLKREAINTQKVSSTAVKKVQATSSAVDDTLNATINVEALYAEYIKLLNTSIAQVEQMYDILVESTTITSTTLIISSTSTSTTPALVVPCGSFSFVIKFAF